MCYNGDMICHIVGAGDFFARHLRVDAGDMVIAADGGLARLLAAGVRPDFVVGDFDSCDLDVDDFNVKKLPTEKDETDMRSAIGLAYGKGCRHFHIHGGTGGRPDHTFANIQCLAWLSRNAGRGFLYFEDYFMTAVTDGDLTISGAPGGYVSVFAYGGGADGVSLAGLKYKLVDAFLADDDVLGTSNEFTGAAARISVKRGTLIITAKIL